MTIKNKYIIITGANSGIGLECVKQFSAEFGDCTIIAISRSIDNLNQLNYPNLKLFKCNVFDYAQLNDIIINLTKNGSISLLINAAGIAYPKDFCSLGINKKHQTIETNVIGLTNMIDLVLPIMRDQKQGTIINVSSLSDRYPRPLTAVYAATKAYVKNLSDSLRLSEAKYNIRVSNVAPGIVDTPLLAGIEFKFDEDQIVSVSDFVSVLKFIYNMPNGVCIRDLTIAATKYEN